MIVNAYLDYDSHSCSRATGLFQVIELADENGNNMTHLVNNGDYYLSVQQLECELNKKIPGVKLIEVD